MNNKSIFKVLCFLVCCPILSATAADSTWLLCQTEGGNPHDELVPVISSYEHRNGPDLRKTELFLIYGGHLLTGSFDNTEADAGDITLQSVIPSETCEKENFIGKIKINYSENTMWLKGLYSQPGDTPKAYEFNLNCVQKN
jgi:hypothetical protein